VNRDMHVSEPRLPADHRGLHDNGTHSGGGIVTVEGTTASFPELNAVELQLIADGRMINAVKTYRDRTGVDLKTAKAAIDAAR